MSFVDMIPISKSGFCFCRSGLSRSDISLFSASSTTVYDSAWKRMYDDRCVSIDDGAKRTWGEGKENKKKEI